MNVSRTCLNQQHKNIVGFTLIELVVTLIILGIIAATVAPKFFDARGTEEVTIQHQVVSILRTIQLRRMQQSIITECFTVEVTPSKLTLLATNTDSPPNCDTTDAGYTTTLEIDAGSEVAFQATESGYTFSFDVMGRPINCATPCEITINGQTSRKVSINAEGYISSVNI